MIRPSRAVATIATAVLLASCSHSDTHSDRDQHVNVEPATARPTSASAYVTRPASPHASRMTTSPVAGRNNAVSTPVIPDPATSRTTPISVAKAWAIAANSSSYLDPNPGSWTIRAAPFVTGAEAAAEEKQRSGRGGSTWRHIQVGKCVSSLRDLVAGIPSDAPSGPDRHTVYVAATAALSCATGHVQLSDFAAQLTVIRVHGRWLVAQVRH